MHIYQQTSHRLHTVLSMSIPTYLCSILENKIHKKKVFFSDLAQTLKKEKKVKHKTVKLTKDKGKLFKV